MTKLLTSVATASLLMLTSTGAFAGCFGHTAMTVAKAAEQPAAMSTYSGDPKTLAADEDEATVAVVEPCAADDAACAPKTAE